LVLRGRTIDADFQISEVFLPGSITDAQLQAIAGTPLLPFIGSATFGVEQRVAVQRVGEHLVVDCTAGALPAGVALRLPSRGLPNGAALAAVLDYTATRAFGLGISDGARVNLGDPLVFATLPNTASRAAVALPTSDLDFATAQVWTLVCPALTAHLELRLFRIDALPARAPPARALWVWQSTDWLHRPVELLNRLAAAGATTAFITVPVNLPDRRVENKDALQNFVASAFARGIEVWAVAGDPQAVLPAGRASFALRAAAFARFNRESPAASKLKGVQYDVEPYLNAGYQLDPPAWHAAYVEMLHLLRREGGDLKLDIAIPFWWSTAKLRNGLLLDALVDIVDSITVMNYRTEMTAIKTSAQPFLEWGARSGRQVRIALEVGSIADEEDRTYVPDSEGEVLLHEDGGTSWLLVCDVPASMARARAFRFTHQMRMPGGSVTFHNDRDTLSSLLQELEHHWSAWQVFEGVALHEY
jgi:hypothetical protein